MPGSLARLSQSAAWRVRRVRRTLWSAHETVFWVADAEEAAWYPDLAKVEEIGRSFSLAARRATPDDLELFRRFHASNGHPLGARRLRLMHRRWRRGEDCWIALDAGGEIVAHMWAAYRDVWVDVLGRRYPVGPLEVMHYDVDTRKDQHGSMGFMACVCAALPVEVGMARRRIISWGTPEIFESFRKFHWWTGLGNLKPRHLIRCTRILGVRFHHTVPLAEDWAPGSRRKPPVEGRKR